MKTRANRKLKSDMFDAMVFKHRIEFFGIILGSHYFSYIPSSHICSFHFAELLYEKANDEKYGNWDVWFDVIIFYVWRQQFFEILLYDMWDKA
jgi:hypothetical protein